MREVGVQGVGAAAISGLRNWWAGCSLSVGVGGGAAGFSSFFFCLATSFSSDALVRAMFLGVKWGN